MSTRSFAVYSITARNAHELYDISVKEYEERRGRGRGRGRGRPRGRAKAPPRGLRVKKRNMVRLRFTHIFFLIIYSIGIVSLADKVTE